MEVEADDSVRAARRPRVVGKASRAEMFREPAIWSCLHRSPFGTWNLRST